MKNVERFREICTKLERMSEALMEEAIGLKHDDLSDLAAILGILGNAYQVPKERFIIREIFDMYSAKKIIDAMGGGSFGNSTEEGFNPDDPITND